MRDSVGAERPMDVLGMLAYVYDDALGYLGLFLLFIQPLRVGLEEHICSRGGAMRGSTWGSCHSSRLSHQPNLERPLPRFKSVATS